jgi:predicted nucleotidyltransferase/DNA-binding XRE family transcriptional regulator
MDDRVSVVQRAARGPARRAGHDDIRPPTPFQGALIAARRASGLTQAELAARVRTTQSAIARLESGTVTPTVETLCRLADALGLRFEISPQAGLAAHPVKRRGLTLADLRARREEILRIAAAHGARNVRVFGSVARGEAGPDSDVDFLVDLDSDNRGFEFFGLLEDLRRALEELLGCPVDVGETVQAHAHSNVQQDAVPL